MKDVIREIVEAQNRLCELTDTLKNPTYWINKAKEETDFVPEEDAWIHVEVTLWRIEISVYSSYSGSAKNSKHWINGQWFDTSFPKTYPSHSDILTLL